MFVKVLVLLVLGMHFVFSFNGECQSGWKNYNGHCYYVSREKMSWFEAKKFCEKYHSWLARITSDKENDFLIQQLILDGKDNYWIGGTDTGREKIWTWESTGEKLTFSKWNSGQPDNGGSKEHCLELRKSMKYNWNDYQCQVALNFVCEKSEYKCNRCGDSTPCSVQQLMKKATKKN